MNLKVFSNNVTVKAADLTDAVLLHLLKNQILNLFDAAEYDETTKSVPVDFEKIRASLIKGSTMNEDNVSIFRAYNATELDEVRELINKI